MKRIASLLVLLLACLVAPDLPGARSQPAPPANDPEEIKILQYLLLWSTDYAGQVDGSADYMLQQSVRDFQARAGFRASGSLDQAQAKQLVKEAKAAIDRVGYAYGPDTQTKAFVALPRALLGEAQPTKTGSRYADTEGLVEVETVHHDASEDVALRQIYRAVLDPLDKTSVIQNVFRGDHFVLAWFAGSNFHMMRFHDRAGEVRGIKVRFDRGARSAFHPIAVAIVHDYSPFAAAEQLASLRAPNLRAPVGPQEPRRNPSGRYSISSGSGFVVSQRGHIITNAHVVEDCTSISTSSHKNVKLVGVDKRNDLALLLPPGNLVAAVKVASFAAESVRLGEDVATFGFPLRDILADQLHMTTGIVSSLAGLRGDPKFIQISAPVQRGNSGGPVIDLMGRVIGVVTSKLDALGVAQQSGGDLPQIVNFAVRHELVVSFMRRNNVEPVTSQPREIMKKTDLASAAAAFTVSITCERR